MSSEKNDIKQNIKYETMCLAKARSTPVSLATPTSLGYYLTFSMLGLDAGYAFALFLDKKKRLLRTVKLKHANEVSPFTVLEAINMELDTDSKIKYFLLVHNHKNKPLIPSPEDIMTTDIVSDRYRGSSAVFLGHYITSDLSYILLTENGIICRKYTNSTESPGTTE